ncbi:RHS repeat domain-containing protein [Agromyces silvae]|uniref:RHS repeat domain-containing protein n=1 Tax=Agromyces silvae TaxID=3388266 RepID=UPI00280B2157|nr:RHS repeat-associated core domain-containing protein [Agromyces protaetiae]
MTARRRRFRIALVASVCAALLTGGLPSAWASASDDSAPIADLGTFGLGGGLDAVVDPADGSVRFGISAGGLALTWNSREVGVDRFGFGGGWSLGLARVETRGGVRVFPASGGVFEMDATHPSGLLGYPLADVAFRRAEAGAALEGRDGGPAVRYAYVLHELGGTRTYFTDAGDPVVHVAADGARTDWRWVDGFDHHLGAVVNADGLVTELDWSDPSEVVVRPGANVTAAPEGSGAGGVWRVRLDGGRLDRVRDPVGRETHIGYERAGLASRVVTASGAITVLTWHPTTDGVPRVAEVRTHDATGREYLSREWWAVGGVAPSGWPAVGDGAGPAEYSTVLTDGETRVVSTFGAQRAMTVRAVDVVSPSGQLRVHEQSFELPETGPATPLVARKPTGVTVTSRDAGGGARSVHESYVYDDLGRIVQRSAADGTVTGWEYDSVVPEGALLPVGLPVRETTTAPDGLVASSRSELNAERTAPIVVEATRGTGDAEQVTARTALTYEGAVVTEQRVYPGGDPAAVPVVTTRTRDVDLDAGTVTVEETAAAGTDAEMTVSSVASLVHGGALVDRNAVGGTSSTSYDAAGRPVGVQDAAGRVMTIVYRFDAVRGVDAVATTAPSGVTVTEERDLLGRVVRTYDNVTPAGVIADDHIRVIETRAYPSGGVEEVTDAWGATTRTEHDVFGRPVRIALPNGLVQAVAHDDVAGTVTTGASPTGSLADAEQTITRRFDAAGRVTATIDVSGARTTFAYDATGLLIRGADGSSYVWDAANRQAAQITADGARIETAYWADGTRKQLAGPSGRTTFFWDGDTLLTEQHSSVHEGRGSASYLLGLNRHARSVERADGTSETAHFGNDRHGNVTELTDASGQVTARSAYTDYGVPILSSGTEGASGAAAAVGDLERNPFGYAGEYTHGDGSQFLRVRTYQPGSMAFSSRDTEPLHTVYGYADANPIMLVDPSGRDAELDWWAVGLAAYSVVAAGIGVLALLTGGASLGAFGVVGAVFGAADAAFAGYEAWAVWNDTPFMPSDVAVGVSATLALIGTVFGVGGVVKRALPDRWMRAFGTDAEVDALKVNAQDKAKREHFGRTAKEHVGKINVVSQGGELVSEPSDTSPIGSVVNQLRWSPARPVTLESRIWDLRTNIFGGRTQQGDARKTVLKDLEAAEQAVARARRTITTYLDRLAIARGSYQRWSSDFVDMHAFRLNYDLDRTRVHIADAVASLKNARASTVLPHAVGPQRPTPAFTLDQLIGELNYVDTVLKKLPRY